MCFPVQTGNTSSPFIVLTCYMRNTCNYFPWYNTTVLKVFQDSRAVLTPSNGQSSLFILPTQRCYYARVLYIKGSPSASLQRSHWRLCPIALAPDLDISVCHRSWSSNIPPWNTKSQAWKSTLWSYTMSAYRGGWQLAQNESHSCWSHWNHSLSFHLPRSSWRAQVSTAKGTQDESLIA